MSNKKAKFNVISPEFAERLMTEHSDAVISTVKDEDTGDVRFTLDRNIDLGRQVMLGQIGGAGRSYELTDFLALSHEDFMTPNPKKFAKQMSVAGSASGATNPYDEFRRRKGRVKAMSDIYALMRIFKGRKLSKRKAAEAVKIKYGLSESAKYLAEHYTKRWMHLCDSVCHPNLDDDTVWQTKFKTSFPLKARKLFPS